MASEKNKKVEVEWYDNPNVITNLIILMIGLIVILSQSFAVNNNLSVLDILSSILNHNISYLLVCIYFVALKTKTGKQYFDFFNIFMIILYALTSVTSLLTVLQSFGLGSLLGFAIDLAILIYIIHTFLRSTSMWKSLGMSKSPFNEINNSGYYYSILILSITLLAVNLIFTTSLDGTILTLMDTAYTILFIRYIYLYGVFLDSKKISVDNEGNFDEYRELIKDKVEDITEDINDKAKEIREDIIEKIEDANFDKKLENAKNNVSEVIENVKESVIDAKEEVVEMVKEAELNKKLETAKKKVTEIVDRADIDEKVESAKKKVNEVVEDIREATIEFKEDVVEKIGDAKTDNAIETNKIKFFSRKKDISKIKDNKKGNVKKKIKVKKGDK